MTTKSFLPNLNLDNATNQNVVNTDTLNGNIVFNTGNIGNVDPNYINGIPIDLTTPPTTGQVLNYTNVNTWKPVNVTATSILGYPIVGSPTNGQVLVFNNPPGNWSPITLASTLPNGAYGDDTNGSYGQNLSVNSYPSPGGQLFENQGQTNDFIGSFTVPNSQYVLQIKATAISSGGDESITNAIFLCNGTTVVKFSQDQYSTNYHNVNFATFKIVSNTTIYVQQQLGSTGSGSNYVAWNIMGNYSSINNGMLASLAINATPTAT